jgi:hypothetical protein
MCAVQVFLRKSMRWVGHTARIGEIKLCSFSRKRTNVGVDLWIILI